MKGYAERFYRDFSPSGRWVSFRVKAETSDLFIRAERDLTDNVRPLLEELRGDILRHIEIRPDFLTSLDPLEGGDGEAEVIRRMYEASRRAGVGPMAAVAGAIAECLGEALSPLSRELIIENGGDIWLRLEEPAAISIYAGLSRFSGKLGLRVRPEQTPLGLCTSSGRVGHSLSLGRADAATVLSRSASLADAVATAAGNRVRSEKDIAPALEWAREIPEVTGVLILLGDSLGALGDIELTETG